MSEIRMCDNCGNIFSVNAKGWTEYTVKVNQFNAVNHGAQTRHMGPECQPLEGTTPRPRVEPLEDFSRVEVEGPSDERAS